MIKRFKVSKKRCKNCNNEFEKHVSRLFQITCSVKCAIEYNRKRAAVKQVKIDRAEIKALAEKIKTPAQWKNDLQKVFNQYIRVRDMEMPCISCGIDMSNRKGDASHYYAVSIAPSLHFDEDNVHLACVPCNQYKSGNLIEYGLRLPSRIGKEKFDALIDKKQLNLKLTVAEIKELIGCYKIKTKNLLNNIKNNNK